MKDYKRILQGVVNIINITKKSDIGFANICAYIGDNCPELKESEDERIRKALLEMVHDTTGDSLWVDYNVHKEDAIAWLEKQGEHANFLSKIQIGDKVTRNKDGVLVNLSQLKRIAKPAEEYNITGIGSKNAQGKLGEMIKNLKPVNEVLEQKPDWNEKYIADVFEKVGLAKIAREHSNDTLTNALQDAMIELSKFTPQPKQEWSEEDEVLLKLSVENLTELKDRYGEKYGRVGECIDWLESKLESFKPQNTWKPSDEQMYNLSEAAHYDCAFFDMEILKGLYDDLKKLMEE